MFSSIWLYSILSKPNFLIFPKSNLRHTTIFFEFCALLDCDDARLPLSAIRSASPPVVIEPVVSAQLFWMFNYATFWSVSRKPAPVKLRSFLLEFLIYYHLLLHSKFMLFSFDESKVLDLFSGSGSFGI